jgi:hypothetical protein
VTRKPIVGMPRYICTCEMCQCRHEYSTAGRNGRARSRRGRYFALRCAKSDTKSNVPHTHTHTLVLAVLHNVALHRHYCDQGTANCPEVFLSNPGEHVDRRHRFLSVLLELLRYLYHLDRDFFPPALQLSFQSLYCSWTVIDMFYP